MELNLFNNQKDSYGDKYKDHLFEQYRIYIQGIESISDRRQSALNFFITINSVLISIIGISFSQNILENFSTLRLFVSLIGVAICVIFWFLIRSYKQLNTGKFKVLHKIEEQLPLSLFKYEWKELGGGEDKKIYFPFSHVELYIPWLIGIIYLTLSIYFIFN